MLFKGSRVVIANDYYNVTEVLKKYPHKRVSRWWNSERTKEYANELINSDVHFCTSSLMISEKGNGGGGSTKIHKSMIIDFARWLDPKFAIACDQFIYDYISKQEESNYLLQAQVDRLWDVSDRNDLYA